METVYIFQENKSLKAWGSNVLEEAKTDFDLRDKDYIIQPASFWTRKTFEQVGPLNESLHYGFDWDWFLRAKIKKVPFLSAE